MVFEFVLNDAMSSFKISSNLTNGKMNFETKLNHLTFETGNGASLHMGTGYAERGSNARGWHIEVRMRVRLPKG